MAVVRRRTEVGEAFASISDFNSSHYFRLMGLASVELLLGIPWSVYACLYLNIFASGASASPIHPYKSWTSVHAKFSHVGQFPALEWKQSHITVVSLELSRWANVICAFIFFGLFGFAQEAQKNYRQAFNSVAKRVGYTTSMHSGLSSSSAKNQSMSMNSHGVMPIFISRKIVSKRDSFASFSTDLSLGDDDGTLDHAKELHSSAN
jgi:pheromone a factor receptor